MSGQLKIKFDSWGKTMTQTAVTGSSSSTSAAPPPAAASAAPAGDPAAPTTTTTTSVPTATPAAALQGIAIQSASAAAAAAVALAAALPQPAVPAAVSTVSQPPAALPQNLTVISHGHRSSSAAAAVPAAVAELPPAAARNLSVVQSAAAVLLPDNKGPVTTTATTVTGTTATTVLVTDKKPSFGSGVTSAFTSMTASSDQSSSVGHHRPIPQQLVLPSTTLSSVSSSHSGTPGHNWCCLTEEGVKRCTRIAGNASYSKRIQKIVQQKKMRLSIDHSARHVYICDFHKNQIQSTRLPGDPCPVSLQHGSGRQLHQSPATGGTKRKRKDHVGEEDFLIDSSNENSMLTEQDLLFSSSSHYEGGVGGDGYGEPQPHSHHHHHHHHNQQPHPPPPQHQSHGRGGGGKNSSGGQSLAAGDLDLSCLQVNTLRRYKKHFHVQAKPGLNKQMLAESVQRHLKSISLNEKEAITFFIFMVKMNRNKLDKNCSGGGDGGAGGSSAAGPAAVSPGGGLLSSPAGYGHL